MKRIKIILDVIMIILMLLLMNLQITGLNIHEILGIIIFALFILHKVLNKKWIMAMSKNIFNKNVKMKTKVMYWLDVILLIVLTINVLTGILISKCILTNITVNNVELTTHIHNIVSIISIVLISIHLAFHLENIIAKIKKYFGKPIGFSKIDIIVKSVYTIIAVTTVYILVKSILFKENNNKTMTNTILNNTVITKKEDDDEQTNSNTTNSTVIDMPESIEEYLGKLFCTGCGRHCPLTSPQCGKGMSSQTAKVQEYNKTYNTNVTYSSSNNAKPRI